mgnify:CR=1 FL=1
MKCESKKLYQEYAEKGTNAEARMDQRLNWLRSYQTNNGCVQKLVKTKVINTKALNAR